MAWLSHHFLSFFSCTHYTTHAIYERKKEWEKINSLHYSSLDDIDAFLIIETSPWDSQHQCGPFHSKNFMTNRRRERERLKKLLLQTNWLGFDFLFSFHIPSLFTYPKSKLSCSIPSPPVSPWKANEEFAF